MREERELAKLVREQLRNKSTAPGNDSRFTPNMTPNMAPNMHPNMHPNMTPHTFMQPNMQPNMHPNMTPNMTPNMHPKAAYLWAWEKDLEMRYEKLKNEHDQFRIEVAKEISARVSGFESSSGGGTW